MKIYIIALLSLLIFSGCTSDEENSDANISVEKTLETRVLHGAEYSGFSEKAKHTEILNTQDKYENSLLLYSPSKAEEVDFSIGVVLLIYRGEKSTGGYSIKLANVIDQENSILANIEYHEAGEGCVVPSAFSNPYQFVWVPSKKELLVSESIVATPCD